MLTASLRAFKKKTKPGSQASPGFITLHGTTHGCFLSRKIGLGFSARAEKLAFIDPNIENRVLAITQAFLRNSKSSKTHRLSRTVTFASLGLDCLDSIDLIMELEDKLGLNISHSDANIVTSIYEACVVFTSYSEKKLDYRHDESS